MSSLLRQKKSSRVIISENISKIMKFWLHLFSVALLLKTVWAINCHVVTYDTESCLNYDSALDFFECTERHKIEEVQECQNEDTCMTWTLKLVDETEFVWKSCGHSKKTCEILELYVEEPFKKLLITESSKCEVCKTDMCNNKGVTEIPKMQEEAESYATSSAPAPMKILMCVIVISTHFLF